MQSVVAGGVLLVAGLILLLRRRETGTWLRPVAAVLCVVTVGGAAYTYTATTQRIASLGRLEAAIPRVGMESHGFAGSDTCLGCHPGQHASWHASYHRTMTQPATPETVIGDFDDVDVELDGHILHLSRDGDEFQADMVDPAWEKAHYDRGLDPRHLADPPRVRKRILMTTGLHHYQTYWVSDGDERELATFPLVYLREARAWYPRRAVFMLPPGIVWAPQIWNASCINCHSVGGEPIEGQKGIFDTTVAELGIACEACHGPAGKHVRLNRDPIHRYRMHFQDDDEAVDSSIVNPARLDARTSSQVCGRCHSVSLKRRTVYDRGERYRAGDDLDETHWVVRTAERFLDERERAEHRQFARAYGAQNPGYFEGRFWPDGMVRVSGREYTAMIESACYQDGTLSCLSCHSMHESDPDDQLAAGMKTDHACLQCHASFADDIPAHTHHPVGSEGSRCVNCHMPHTTYGLLKAIRSHLIDSPTAASSVRTGRPNACNLCHLDQTLDWTQRHLASWFATPEVEFTRDQHEVPASLLWLLSGDANQRVLSAWSMGWGPALQATGSLWPAPYLARLLDDPYDAVRYVTQRSLRRMAGFEDLAYDSRDPPRTRMEAVQQALDLCRQLGETGQLPGEVLERLMRQRDDRPVELKE